MAAALTDLQANLLDAFHTEALARFVRLSGVLDQFAVATFGQPVEGYVRRLLWALAADAVIPEDACDDPWGPALGPVERDAVRLAVQDARAARA
jgi:4-hydroxy-tetrahydrodipicolinate synthase